jgi:two-component system NtrC family sensor kinase
MEMKSHTLNHAFERVTEGVLILDENQRVTGLNASARALLDVRESAVKLESIEKLFRFKHPADFRRFTQAFQANEELELNTDLVLDDAREIPCTISMTGLEWGGGHPIGTMIILKDRKAQINMERRLIQMGKMNALGNLMAGFAHELNNPLTSVIGFSELFKGTCEDGSIREEMGVIHSHAVRCKKIVDNLLAFAREQKQAKKLIDINAVIRTTIDLFRYHLERNGIKIRLDLDPGLPMTLADAAQIQQVLVNLIANARYELTRLEKPGVIAVATEHRDGKVMIRVMDSGPGIPDEMMDRIFDPFFTTKPDGMGTGIGLSSTRGIMQGHDGSVSVRNLTSGGAEFLITLPES